MQKKWLKIKETERGFFIKKNGLWTSINLNKYETKMLKGSLHALVNE